MNKERPIRVGDIWCFDGEPENEVLVVAVDNFHRNVRFGNSGRMSFERFLQDYNYKTTLRND